MLRKWQRPLLGACVISTLAACANRSDEVTAKAALSGYREVAHATYADALNTAEELGRRVAALLANPGPAPLAEARSAWRAARRAYSQSEGLRFGNWFVDEWETRVNAWPIDEGFLDYVQSPYSASPTNPLARANLVASQSLSVGGTSLSLESLNRSTLASAQGRADIESNISTGYHAIEFLLWGQDLNPHGPGQRPWTDFAHQDGPCTDGPRSAPLRHCRRRAELLQSVVDLLIWDLREMTAVWSSEPGSYGDRLVQGDSTDGLRRALYGLMRMASFELAGERQRVALLTHAAEEEQDCFSDDTHNSLYFNGMGLHNLYYGRYDTQLAAASLADLARDRAPDLAQELDHAFAQTLSALAKIQGAGEAGETFDRLIQPDHPFGAEMIGEAIQSLEHLAAKLELLGHALGLGNLNPQTPRSSETPA